MKTLLMIWVTLFSFSAFSQAEFVNENLVTDENETVLDSKFFTNLRMEEPIFSKTKGQREIASIEPSRKTPGVDSLGQLEVVKEIPYTYRWVSHRTMQMRVLNELEGEDSKTKEKASN